MIYIVLIICFIVISVEIVSFEIRIKEFIATALCELMAAVFNQEAIKAKCAEAFERGEEYVDISEV